MFYGLVAARLIGILVGARLFGTPFLLVVACLLVLVASGLDRRRQGCGTSALRSRRRLTGTAQEGQDAC